MKSPFKFLDAFELRDRDVFFGRDAEIDQLYQMVNKNRLVLVYGQSGTGKTSLVQCGLASRYDATDWLPVFMRRGNNLNEAFIGAMNRVLRRDAADEAGAEVVTPAAIEAAYGIYLRPLYLIFDQFEELFILGEAAEQQQFIKTIASIHQAESPCRILFIIREEYLAALYEFEKTIPSLFDRRLRVEPMSAAKVKDVLLQSFGRFNITLENPAHNLQQIVDNVSDRRAGISLPNLQIYLDQFWQDDFKRTYPHGVPSGEGLPALKFKTLAIEKFGDISAVLARFLSRHRVELQAALEARFSGLKGDEIQRILDVFVTEDGTKRPVTLERNGDEMSLGSIPEDASHDLPDKRVLAIGIGLLEKSRMLRIEGDTAELAHDSLAALVDRERSDEQREVNEVRNRLKNAMTEYTHGGEWPGQKLLLDVEELLPKLGLDETQFSFFEKSREEYRKREHAEREEWIKRENARRKEEEMRKRAREAEAQAKKEAGLRSIAEQQQQAAETQRQKAQKMTIYAVCLSVAAILTLLQTIYLYRKTTEAKDDLTKSTIELKEALAEVKRKETEKEKTEFLFRLEKISQVLRGGNCPDASQIADLDTMQTHHINDPELLQRINTVIAIKNKNNCQ